MKLNDPSLLTEMKCGTNLAYVLNDKNVFFMTGFKVLQSLEKSGFLRCVKMTYNGRIQLLYLTHTGGVELKSLTAMLHSLDADSFVTVIRNLLAGVVHAKSVGFLHCPNIEVKTDRVFVDPKTLSVYLIYLPLMEHCVAEDTLEFETELRANLIALIHSLPGFQTQSVKQMVSALADGVKTLEDVVRGLGGSDRREPYPQPSPAPAPSGGGSGTFLTLCAVHHPKPFEARIPPRKSVLGAQEGGVDFVISGNQFISRKHCEIDYQNGQFYLSDRQSANGTYLNGVRLEAYSPQPLHDGDEIRLANSTFSVRIG